LISAPTLTRRSGAGCGSGSRRKDSRAWARCRSACCTSPRWWRSCCSTSPSTW